VYIATVFYSSGWVQKFFMYEYEVKNVFVECMKYNVPYDSNPAANNLNSFVCISFIHLLE
jgi:hypothetical protein